jgi:hypothetical protein
MESEEFPPCRPALAAHLAAGPADNALKATLAAVNANGSCAPERWRALGRTAGRR